MTTRPWLASGRSNEWEWNGLIGRRFATKERADEYAARLTEDGCWEVRVLCAPVPKPGGKKR